MAQSPVKLIQCHVWWAKENIQQNWCTTRHHSSTNLRRSLTSAVFSVRSLNSSNKTIITWLAHEPQHSEQVLWYASRVGVLANLPGYVANVFMALNSQASWQMLQKRANCSSGQLLSVSISYHPSGTDQGHAFFPTAIARCIKVYHKTWLHLRVLGSNPNLSAPLWYLPACISVLVVTLAQRWKMEGAVWSHMARP